MTEPHALGEVRRFLAASLVRPVERTRPETRQARLRRRVVVGATVAVGAAALGLALTIRPGDPLFYAASAAVAALWAVGALASGRLYLGWGRTRSGGRSRGVLQGFLLGLLLLAIFLGGALVVARIPPLRGPVEGLLDHARYGSIWIVAAITAVNGVAEELFFRGAVYAALDRRLNVLGSTVLYTASTLFTGVPLLTFAALCLGLLTAAQRRVTGGVLGPIASHLTWSLGMLFLLPATFALGG
ncbi:MAG TPA: CPBP family intramembrane metalloprotease [Propionibacteriaceae bacterium]|jgi:membrane protease YdiL (CAAX protease family)|nr:CPBP family intramembrane metalloprotease [Propionibacteriaceae bacterium]HBY22153.1 CPBP family intramembrane metalloprotease [Propionibacteriaceae bacterium]